MGILNEDIISENTMQERILWTLEAYLLTNEEVMSENDVQNLKEQIQAVKNYKPLLPFFRKWK